MLSESKDQWHQFVQSKKYDKNLHQVLNNEPAIHCNQNNNT